MSLLVDDAPSKNWLHFNERQVPAGGEVYSLLKDMHVNAVVILIYSNVYELLLWFGSWVTKNWKEVQLLVDTNKMYYIQQLIVYCTYIVCKTHTQIYIPTHIYIDH